MRSKLLYHIEMNGTTEQTENYSGNSNRVDGEMGSTKGRDINAKVSSSSTSMSESDDDEFVSPRKLILEARSSSSSEELPVSNAKVKSRHRWIEDTLLKNHNKRPLSENTRRILASRRTSLPAENSGAAAAAKHAPPRSSLGSGEASGDEVLARARAAIEGRKKSRETAKARVSADIMALVGGGTSLSASDSSSSSKDGDAEVAKGGVEDDAEPPALPTKFAGPSTSHVTSLPGDATKVKEEVEDGPSSTSSVTSAPEDGAEVEKASDQVEDTGYIVVEKVNCNREAATAKASLAREKARARLNATMALLAANSSGRSNISRRSDEAASINQKVAEEISAKAREQAEVEDDEELPSVSETSSEDQVEEAERSEQDGSVVELTERNEPGHLQGDKMVRGRKLVERTEREKAPAGATKRAQPAGVVEQSEQRSLLVQQLQKEIEETRRSAKVRAERLEQERSAFEAEQAEQAESYRLDEDKCKQRRILAEQLQKEREEAHREAQFKAVRFEQERLAAETQAAKEANLEMLCEDKSKLLEQEELAAESEATDVAELERLEEEKIEQRFEEARRFAKAKDERFEKERLAAETGATNLARSERLGQDKMNQRRILAEQLQEKEEEAPQMAKAKAERSVQGRPAAEAVAKQTKIERFGEEEKIEQRRTLAEQLLHEEEEARQSAKARAERLEQERLAYKAELAEKAEMERLEKERIEKRRIYAEQLRREEEEARRLVQAKAERLVQETLAAGPTRQAELESLEEGRVEHNPEEVISKEGAETYNKTAQPPISFGPIGNNSSGSSDTAPRMDKPSENSEASSLGQVDRLLYRGKTSGDLHQDDDIHQDYSDGDIFEELTNSETDSEQSSTLIDMPRDDNTELSPGPMWKKAAEEAAFATALAKDFLPRDVPVVNEVDPLPFITSDGTNLTSKGTGLREVQEAPTGSTESSSSNEEGDIRFLEESETAEQEEALGLREWKGFNWNRMLYMLLLGIQAGLLPSIYAQLTCHFITGDAPVGEDGVEFGLYLGLQKFTPIDSAFLGYKYCQDYDSDFNYNQPTLPHIAGFAATILGTIPLIVIGMYLGFSMTHKNLWIGSMWMLYMGFICQISTLSVFLLDLCQEEVECSMGPGAWTSCISSIVWFLLSIEMKINSPFYQPVKSTDGVVVIEKDSPLISGMKKLWRRINGEDTAMTAPSLSRTAMKKQKERIGKAETEMSRYRPPEIV